MPSNQADKPHRNYRHNLGYVKVPCSSNLDYHGLSDETYPIGSMGLDELVYLPTCMIDFYGQISR